ncbi:MAG: ABC transporter ATP-binding protein [bacterium]
MSAVRTDSLSKRYRQGFRRPPVDALRNVTLEIPRGEVFGFLGPNGSGKTTLLKCLLNIIYPTSGQMRLLDQPVTDRAVKRQVGYLPESPYFYDRFTGVELLEFYGGLYGMSRRDIAARIPVVIEEVGLGETAAKRPLRTYSKGMLQRIGIAQAIVAEPELIILDEPSTGLDPVGRRQIKDLIRQYFERGHTVFLNSHILEDIENLCHRVGVIYQGDLLACETVEALTRTEHVVLVRVRDWTEAGALAVMPLVESHEQRPDGVLKLVLQPGVEAPQIVRALVAAELDVFEVNPQIIRLEDRFLDLLSERGGVPESVRAQLAGGLVLTPAAVEPSTGGIP